MNRLLITLLLIANTTIVAIQSVSAKSAASNLADTQSVSVLADSLTKAGKNSSKKSNLDDVDHYWIINKAAAHFSYLDYSTAPHSKQQPAYIHQLNYSLLPRAPPVI